MNGLQMREKDPEEELKEAFRVFDAEGSGMIGMSVSKYKTFIFHFAEVEELRLILSQLPVALDRST